MNTDKLIQILKTLPKGSFDVVVLGREQNGRIPKIAASIMDGKGLPDGWRAVMEVPIQHVPGTRRIIWTYERELK